MNKLGNFGLVLNYKIKANASINAKLHVSLLGLCSVLDSLWNSDHRTSRHTQKSLDSGTLLGAHRTAESSTPKDFTQPGSPTIQCTNSEQQQHGRRRCTTDKSY